LQPWGGKKLQALRLHDWWAWYKLYLASAAWRRRRQRLIRLRRRTCEACGWTAPLGLDRMLNCHHLTYDRVGRERDEDLQLLCEGCHDRKHPDKAKGGEAWRKEV
jgi:5-methylcytosine-specific restriction endonuclease McrA